MKYLFISIQIIFFTLSAIAQTEEISKHRFVYGLSAPELLHMGYTYRLSNSSQFGFNAGVGPTWGSIWPTLSVEHRLYVGSDNKRINQKTSFFRQGSTFFPSARNGKKFTLNLTGGKDVMFKNINNGITIDAGIFYLPNSGRSTYTDRRSLTVVPALRFQLYCSL